MQKKSKKKTQTILKKANKKMNVNKIKMKKIVKTKKNLKKNKCKNTNKQNKQ